MTLVTHHHLQPTHFHSPPLHLAWGWRGLLSRYWKFCQCWGFCRCCMHLCPCPDIPGLSPLPFPGCDLHAGHTRINKTSQTETRVALQKSCGICFELVTMHFKSSGMNSSCLLTHFLMSEEWHKYVKILEREDQEFKRAMQEEVSIISILFYFSLNLVVNNRILAGAGIITQREKGLSNFQVMLSSFML